MSEQFECDINGFKETDKLRKKTIEKLLDSFGFCSILRDDSGKIVDFVIEFISNISFLKEDFNNLIEYKGKRLLELFPKFKGNGIFNELVKVVDSNIPLARKTFLYEEIEGLIQIKCAYDIRIVKLGDGIAATWRRSTHNAKSALMELSIDEKANILQRQIEENTRQLYEAREYDKLKTEFFTNISHELKTPLNILLSSLQLFELLVQNNKLSEDKDKVNKLTKGMKQNCYRLLRLINNLIDTTRIDTGFYRIYPQNCNIVSVVEDVVMSTAEYVSNKGIDLLFDTETEEIVIACDPDKIERIVLNLLSNAVKFNKEKGSIFVNISLETSFVCISVKDNGIGIEKDKLGLIFERFRQIDTSLTRQCEGSGIGLSLVKSLVEMHDGTIEVKSEYGAGSEFIVKLPLREAEDDSYNLDYVQRSIVGDEVGNSETEKINIEFSDIYFNK